MDCKMKRIHKWDEQGEFENNYEAACLRGG